MSFNTGVRECPRKYRLHRTHNGACLRQASTRHILTLTFNTQSPSIDAAIIVPKASSHTVAEVNQAFEKMDDINPTFELIDLKYYLILFNTTTFSIL